MSYTYQFFASVPLAASAEQFWASFSELEKIFPWLSALQEDRSVLFILPPEKHVYVEVCKT